EGATARSIIAARLPDGPATAPGNTPIINAWSLQRLAAEMALDTGDPKMAKAWLDAHDRWLEWSGAVLGKSEGQALWAQYHRQTGNARESREHAERALTYASEPQQPLALLVAHRLLGELDTEAGRYTYAAAHLRESLTLADACAAPYERALTHLAHAELYAAAG